jgi:hypothetical protein
VLDLAPQHVLFWCIYVPNSLCQAHVTTAETVFNLGLRRHPLPTSGNRSTYSHVFFVDTPRGRRYLAYLRHATFYLSRRMQVLLLRGGHQKVIDAVADGMRAASEQQALRACIESLQGHVISTVAASRSTVGI